jgi:hypothetical protein
MMIGGLGVTFVICVIFILGYLVVSSLEEIEEDNAAARTALKNLDKFKECYTTQRRRTAQLEARIPQTPLELNRIVESAASAVGVSIAESAEVNPTNVDSYVQRGVEIKLRKITLDQLARLMKELEGRPHIVQITELSVNTRWGQHEDLDVEMVVSTFQKNPEAGEDADSKKRKRKRS